MSNTIPFPPPPPPPQRRRGQQDLVPLGSTLSLKPPKPGQSYAEYLATCPDPMTAQPPTEQEIADLPIGLAEASEALIPCGQDRVFMGAVMQKLTEMASHWKIPLPDELGLALLMEGLGEYPADLVMYAIHQVLHRWDPPDYKDRVFPSIGKFTRWIHEEYNERKRRQHKIQVAYQRQLLQAELDRRAADDRARRAAQRPALPAPPTRPPPRPITGPVNMARPRTDLVVAIPLDQMPAWIQADIAATSGRGDEAMDTTARHGVMLDLLRAGLEAAVVKEMVGLHGGMVRIRTVDAEGYDTVMAHFLDQESEI
jgi:hypothetical protein